MNCLSQDPGFGPLKNRLIAVTGLAFYQDRDALLAELIGERLAVLGLSNCSAYAESLSDGELGRAETEVLIEHLTIGETYFFRDADQFAAIRDVILPDILKRRRFSRKLQIWSAGCANGAEPYTLAIMLERALADRIDTWQVNIHATDLNQSFLDQAAAGTFRAASLRSTSDAMKRECFSKKGATWTIHPRYKQWISFHQMNLLKNEFITSFPAGTVFDLVLCRNVMIYFSRLVSTRLVANFHRSLGESGWLVVGASESNLDSLKLFHTVNAEGSRLFQKAPAFQPGKEVREPAALRPVERQPPSSQRARVQPFSLLPPAAPALIPATVNVEGLRQLADRGEWKKAAAYGRQLMQQDGRNAEIYFYRALIFEKLGIASEPERSLRRAIYLDRDFALAHYHLGIVLRSSGHSGPAARSFGNVLKVLAGLPDLALVTAAPDITVTELRELAKMHLGAGNGS